MPVSYQVKFIPGKYRYQEQATVNGGQRYFGVFRDDSPDPVALTLEENAAKFVCLSCELANSYVSGDGSATRELLAALSRLRQ